MLLLFFFFFFFSSPSSSPSPLASHINAVFLVLICLVRTMVSRREKEGEKREKIRFFAALFSFFLSEFLPVVEIGVLFRVQTLLASCDGRRRRKWRRTCENKKYVRVQTHKYTLLHYSFFLLIYLFLSPTCIKTNSSEHTTTSLIPNGKRSLSRSLSAFLSYLLFFSVCRVRIGQ